MASRVISVGENIVEAEQIVLLGAAFVGHVERRTILRPSAKQKRKHQRGRIPLLVDLKAKDDKHYQQSLGTRNLSTDAYQ